MVVGLAVEAVTSVLVVGVLLAGAGVGGGLLVSGRAVVAAQRAVLVRGQLDNQLLARDGSR